MIHPIAILPPAIRLEMERIVDVHVDECEGLGDGEDVARVEDRSGRGLGRTERVDGADVGGAGEGGTEAEGSETGEGRVRNGSTMP